MPRSQSLWLVVAAALATMPCAGREILTLKNGFSIEGVSHECHEETIVLTTTTGTLEFPKSELVEIEVIEEPKGPAIDVQQKAMPSPEQVLSAAARAQGLTPELVRSVAKVESNLRPEAVSPKGAVGLMQLMPGTAAQLGVLETDLEANALGGAKYLRQLLLQYHGDAALALAAYNAGPGAVAKYGGVPPYSETRRYVLKVLQEYARENRSQGEVVKPALTASNASTPQK